MQLEPRESEHYTPKGWAILQLSHLDLWPTDLTIGMIYGSCPFKTPIMVSLSLIGFKFFIWQGFYAPSHCGLDLWLTYPKSIGIIYGSWPTKTPIMLSLSFIGFKLLSRQGYYAQGHCNLEQLTPKSIGIIYGSWPSMIPRMVYLCEISLNFGKSTLPWPQDEFGLFLLGH